MNIYEDGRRKRVMEVLAKYRVEHQIETFMGVPVARLSRGDLLGIIGYLQASHEVEKAVLQRRVDFVMDVARTRIL